MPGVQRPAVTPKRGAWNNGRPIGQKRPLLPNQVWAIRARLELAGDLRDAALFNVAIDSNLRVCDLVKLKVADLVNADHVRERVFVIPPKVGAARIALVPCESFRGDRRESGRLRSNRRIAWGRRTGSGPDGTCARVRHFSPAMRPVPTPKGEPSARLRN